MMTHLGRWENERYSRRVWSSYDKYRLWDGIKNLTESKLAAYADTCEARVQEVNS